MSVDSNNDGDDTRGCLNLSNVGDDTTASNTADDTTALNLSNNDGDARGGLDLNNGGDHTMTLDLSNDDGDIRGSDLSSEDDDDDDTRALVDFSSGAADGVASAPMDLSNGDDTWLLIDSSRHR